MPAALPLKQPVKVSQLVRRRLRELKRTPLELAEAVKVSEAYMSDLVAGRRPPPAPGRTDLYVPMAKFLRLHRNDLPTCARVERAQEGVGHRRPDPQVWNLVLELCDPARQRSLARRPPPPSSWGACSRWPRDLCGANSRTRWDCGSPRRATAAPISRRACGCSSSSMWGRTRSPRATARSSWCPALRRGTLSSRPAPCESCCAPSSARQRKRRPPSRRAPFVLQVPRVV